MSVIIEQSVDERDEHMEMEEGEMKESARYFLRILDNKPVAMLYL